MKGAWLSPAEAAGQAREYFDSKCVTVGYVIHENIDFIVIAATHDGEPEDVREYHDISMIMCSVIVSRNELENTEKPIEAVSRNTVFAEGRVAKNPERKEVTCGHCGEQGHRRDRCPNNPMGASFSLNGLRTADNDEVVTKDFKYEPDENIKDPDAQEDPLEPGQEKILAKQVQELWVDQKKNSLIVCRELVISLRRLNFLIQKYHIVRP